MSKILLYFLVTIFYSLAIFIVVTELFPKQLDDAIYDIFKPKQYDSINGEDVTISQIINDSSFIETYGTINDSLIRWRFSDQNIKETYSIYTFSTANGFPVNRYPEIRIRTYYNTTNKLILESKNWFDWQPITYEIIDSFIHKIEYDSLLHTKQGAQYWLQNKYITYYINKLPKGSYRLKTNFFGNEVLAYFNIYDTLKAKWEINEQQFIDSNNIEVTVLPQIDTKFIFVGDAFDSMPLFNWKYFVFKDGKWTDENWFLDFKSCGTGTEALLSENKNRIIFKNRNVLRISLLTEFEYYLKKYNLTEPKFSFESYVGMDNKPFDDNFYESDVYKQFIKEEFGDSIAIQLTFVVYPLYWSRYNYQELCSPLMIFNTNEIYENFITQMRKRS